MMDSLQKTGLCRLARNSVIRPNLPRRYVFCNTPGLNMTKTTFFTNIFNIYSNRTVAFVMLVTGKGSIKATVRPKFRPEGARCSQGRAGATFNLRYCTA